MPDAIDIWRAAAPEIDMLAPDIYDYDYASMCAAYNRSGNPLFIPETRGLPPNALGARVLYAFGRHDAIGFSPMGIERPAVPDIELTSAYDVIAQLAPLISEHQGNGTMSAVLLGSKDQPQKVKVGNYTLEVSFLRPRVLPGSPQPAGTLSQRGGNLHRDRARRVLRRGYRSNRHLYSEHAGSTAGRTSHRGGGCFCERPLGSGAPAGRRRYRLAQPGAAETL